MVAEQLLILLGVLSRMVRHTDLPACLEMVCMHMAAFTRIIYGSIYLLGWLMNPCTAHCYPLLNGSRGVGCLKSQAPVFESQSDLSYCLAFRYLCTTPYYSVAIYALSIAK
ncbi:hypothetical protein BDV18DRAFT_48041 [Aspergillus unguis]